jgi:hypothetical protein
LHIPPKLEKTIIAIKKGGMRLDKKTKKGMKNLEAKATPEDLATEKRMIENKEQKRAPKM